MIHLDYRDARPIYAQIIEQFKRQIEAGVLQEGEKLPSVRELAGSLAINPNTIQRAYRELEQQGWNYAETLEMVEDAAVAMKWHSNVPGSHAEEHVIIGVVPALLLFLEHHRDGVLHGFQFDLPGLLSHINQPFFLLWVVA